LGITSFALRRCATRATGEGEYCAKVPYPSAILTSRRVGDFLTDIWEEQRLRGFLSKHIPYLGKKAAAGSNILIDSVGLPNSARFPLTAVSNHNGEIGSEARLPYVTLQEMGLPIYFRSHSPHRSRESRERCGLSCARALVCPAMSSVIAGMSYSEFSDIS
jgi:hypothetical protein